jgi:hypothetical protein
MKGTEELTGLLDFASYHFSVVKVLFAKRADINPHHLRPSSR